MTPERKRLETIFKGIKKRCFNRNCKDYKNYGGRGISVCVEWSTFQGFYDWAMANGYQNHLLIERKNNDEDYCPENCEWTDWFAQAHNKRNNVNITAWGETKCRFAWIRDARCIVSDTTIRRRLKEGMTPEEAMSTPKRPPGFKSKKVVSR